MQRDNLCPESNSKSRWKFNEIQRDRTVVVVLRLVLPMMVTRRGGSRRAGRMKSHIRKDHPGIFQEDHLSLVCSRGTLWPDARGHIGVGAKIQHDGQ